ncbi:MAG: hypothetical protein ACTSQ8_07795 [Candidatus Helarchaeota archaeon]
MSKNIIEILKHEWEKENRKNLQYHIFPEGITGTSSELSCSTLLLSKHAHIRNVPKKTGIKAETGQFMIGTILHEHIQKTLENFYKDHEEVVYCSEIYAPILITDKTIDIEIPHKTIEVISPNILNTGITREHLQMMKGNEPILWPYLIKVPLTFEDLVLQQPEKFKDIGVIKYSPIDAALLTPPGYVFKRMKFKNISALVPFKHPNARFIKIFDIKSAGSYGYYRGGTSIQQKGQFHDYMKGAGLDRLTKLTISKEKAYMKEEEVEWDDKIWEKIIKTNMDLLKEKEKYRDMEYINFREIQFPLEKLGCLQDLDSIGWYSCPFSETYEEITDAGEHKLRIKDICPMSRKVAKEMVLRKFKVGEKYKRFRSKITILEIANNMIHSVNKSRTDFFDTYYYALKNYKKE